MIFFYVTLVTYKKTFVRYKDNLSFNSLSVIHKLAMN